eukprot:CAMPEP_0113684690 /NCGR_PEP_ID=MMETSP0038_2-20120614/14176_1 /TAXON_ID=2898 /ORGANISM="Cryptomonas paramecium" /LENGTH=138 /DNA_ID=CAMNT_0000604533 /DNA_START=45 /DNA_END=461 /DNA_ORIENTATION=- /assembly_acc=CAM_ASM_000170
MVLRITEALRRCGYVVWIDVDMMVGALNQRMAEAVEGAAVVVPCITRAYKASVNCMKELNYADQRRRDMVPLILDAADRAGLLSGQVGLITSNLIYVDFSACAAPGPDGRFDEAEPAFVAKMRELLHALGPRGRALCP